MELTVNYKDGQTEMHKVENDCQIWRTSKNTFLLHPDARIIVKSDDGEVIRDLTYVQTKRGMTMVNSVKKQKAHEETIETAVNAVKETSKKGGCIFIVA